MLDQQDLRNIKDLLESSILASETRTNEKFKKIDERFERIDEKFEVIEEKIDDLASGVAEALSNSNEALSNQIGDHEIRIGKLEAKAA